MHETDSSKKSETFGGDIASIRLPELHFQDDCILPDRIQLELIVDNKLLADVCDGRAQVEPAGRQHKILSELERVENLKYDSQLRLVPMII